MFTFAAYRWCIDTALHLVRTDPAAAARVEADITSLDSFLPLAPPRPGVVRLIQVQIDDTYAMTQTDLDEPILIASMVSTDGEHLGETVIDGWHRVYRARRENRTHLPGLVLSPEAERTARIPFQYWLR